MGWKHYQATLIKYRFPIISLRSTRPRVYAISKFSFASVSKRDEWNHSFKTLFHLGLCERFSARGHVLKQRHQVTRKWPLSLGRTGWCQILTLPLKGVFKAFLMSTYPIDMIDSWLDLVWYNTKNTRNSNHWLIHSLKYFAHECNQFYSIRSSTSLWALWSIQYKIGRKTSIFETLNLLLHFVVVQLLLK